MKFESITMENFMRYKGRNHIEFSCDDVKNVTVVLGDNTVGKTTIAQAFRWGLYGALMANGTKSAGDFQLLNTDILEMMDANSRAKVKVEIAAVDEEKRYIITRETTYTRAFPKLESREFQKKCAMRITELEDMESYVEVDSNEIETLINELFPKNLSHYFLSGKRPPLFSSAHALPCHTLLFRYSTPDRSAYSVPLSSIKSNFVELSASMIFFCISAVSSLLLHSNASNTSKRCDFPFP